MKKTIALVLCLLMVVSLAACGGQTTAEESSNIQNTDQTETTAPETEQPEESTESVETEAPTETEEETPAFDTSWASNEFEAMIPELPFTGWTVVTETDTIYELELGGLRTANGADTATGFEEDKDSLITYINSLSEYGFTVNETGENYSWLVTDDEGNTIEFMCAEGHCWITFKKASSETNTEENSSIDVSSLGIPELPEGNWKKEQFNDITYIMTIDEIDYADIEKYIETLSSENFTIFEIEPYSGTYCEYQAEKNVGSSGLIINIQYGNDGTDCRVAITEKQYQ